MSITISKHLIHVLRAQSIVDLKVLAELVCTSNVPANVEPSVVESTDVASTTLKGFILLIRMGMHLSLLVLKDN